MDPLSITASAIGIVTFALQAVKLLNDDIHNIKNAPSTLRGASADLNALEPMLVALQDAAKQRQDLLARHRRMLLAVENCFDICKSFRQQLRAWSKEDTDGNLTVSSRVKMGLLGEERIKEFRGKLGDCKGTLTLILVAEQFIELPSDSSIPAMIERSERQLGEQLAELRFKVQQIQSQTASDHGLHTSVNEGHEQIQKQLAEIASRMREVQTQATADVTPEIEQLRNQFAGVQQLKEDLSRLTESLQRKIPRNEEVAKLSDCLLLTEASQDRRDLVETMGRPAASTCQWILRNDLFKAWIQAEPAFIWLRGDTGKGKTMLSIFLSDQIPSQVTGSDTHIIYYFCGKQDEKRNTSAAILRSLLWQLAGKLELTDVIAKHLAEHGIPLVSEYEALWKLLAALMLDVDCGKVYCVIDGLDELEDGTELWLANKLLSLFSPGAREPHLNVFRLLLVSRDIHGFKLRGQSALLDLDSGCRDEIEADISKVIDEKLESVPDWAGFSDEYKIKVRQEVLHRAAGSFVPIGIIMNAILVDRPYSGLLETIRSLPQGLDALYGNTLLSIKNKDQHESPEIIRWVAMAYRPLSLREIANAISTANDLDDAAVKATVQRCGALLKVHGDTVMFSHSSVRDYLLRMDKDTSSVLESFDTAQRDIVQQFRIDPQEAHFEVALKCLELIRDSHLQHRALDSRDDCEGAPLLQYAVLYWPHHARGSGVVGRKIFESTSFVLANAPSLQQNWWRTYVHERPGQDWEQGEKLSPLHIASRFGITEWVRTLLFDLDAKALSKIVNECDVNGLTPLAWAAIGGHDSVVALLLEYKVDVEAQTALYSREGTKWLTSQTIKSYMREVQVGDGMWTGRHTPLYRAAYKGHSGVVKLLLDGGANVHAHGWARSSPIHAACIGGDVNVMNLLLEHGGDEDVNAEIKNSHTTPLHHAVENGHRELAEILLEHGADIRKKQRYSSATVLHFAAVKTPHPSTVELLLEKGADVNARDSHGRKPLHCFVMKHPAPEAVKLLLEYGASINSLNSLRRTALDLSVECVCDRCRATTQVLLVHGGVLNSPTEKGQRNHPELFIGDANSLEPITAATSATLSSDGTESVSQALESSVIGDTVSGAHSQDASVDPDLETEQTSISSAMASNRENSEPQQSVELQPQEAERSNGNIRKRDKFMTKMGGLRKGKVSTQSSDVP